MDKQFNYEKTNGLSKALGGRIHLMEDLLKDNLSYSDIQMIVKAGLAPDFFDLGDEIMTKYTATDGTEYDFPWVVVDNDRYCEHDDGNLYPGLFLQSKYAAFEFIPFDASEGIEATEQKAIEEWYYCGAVGYERTMLDLRHGDTIPYSEYDHVYKGDFSNVWVYKFGYNRWSMSAVRQWLNSDAEQGEWWISQHPGDAPPTERYLNFNGFIKGFEKDFISAISPVKIKTYCTTIDGKNSVDITLDKFWLPSLEEMYGIPVFPGVEGSCFNYYQRHINSDEPTNAKEPARIKYRCADHSRTASYGLRSINLANDGLTLIYTVNSSGIIGTNNVSNGFYFSPVCVIS